MVTSVGRGSGRAGERARTSSARAAHGSAAARGPSSPRRRGSPTRCAAGRSRPPRRRGSASASLGPGVTTSERRQSHRIRQRPIGCTRAQAQAAAVERARPRRASRARTRRCRRRRAGEVIATDPRRLSTSSSSTGKRQNVRHDARTTAHSRLSSKRRSCSSPHADHLRVEAERGVVHEHLAVEVADVDRARDLAGAITRAASARSAGRPRSRAQWLRFPSGRIPSARRSPRAPAPPSARSRRRRPRRRARRPPRAAARTARSTSFGATNWTRRVEPRRPAGDLDLRTDLGRSPSRRNAFARAFSSTGTVPVSRPPAAWLRFPRRPRVAQMPRGRSEGLPPRPPESRARAQRTGRRSRILGGRAGDGHDLRPGPACPPNRDRGVRREGSGRRPPARGRRPGRRRARAGRPARVDPLERRSRRRRAARRARRREPARPADARACSRGSRWRRSARSSPTAPSTRSASRA